MVNTSKKSNYYFSYSNPNIQNLEFNVQEFNFPDIDIEELVLPSSSGDIHYIGDKITFGSVRLNAIIDEDFKIYTDVLDEIFLHKNNDLNEIDLKQFVGTLHVTSNKGNPIISFTFTGAFIRSVGGVVFSDNGQDENINMDIEIIFSNMKYERIV